jgi:hypothetical protein
MKLMLTSSGLNSTRLRKEFTKLLENKVESCKVVMVYALERPEFISYVKEAGEGLERCGILRQNIKICGHGSGKIIFFQRL